MLLKIVCCCCYKYVFMFREMSDEENPAAEPVQVLDVQGDGRWMSQVCVSGISLHVYARLKINKHFLKRLCI